VSLDARQGSNGYAPAIRVAVAFCENQRHCAWSIVSCDGSISAQSPRPPSQKHVHKPVRPANTKHRQTPKTYMETQEPKPSVDAASPLINLPHELIRLLFDHVPSNARWVCGRVCRRWDTIVTYPHMGRVESRTAKSHVRQTYASALLPWVQKCDTVADVVRIMHELVGVASPVYLFPLLIASRRPHFMQHAMAVWAASDPASFDAEARQWEAAHARYGALCENPKLPNLRVECGCTQTRHRAQCVLLSVAARYDTSLKMIASLISDNARMTLTAGDCPLVGMFPVAASVSVAMDGVKAFVRLVEMYIQCHGGADNLRPEIQTMVDHMLCVYLCNAAMYKADRCAVAILDALTMSGSLTPPPSGATSTLARLPFLADADSRALAMVRWFELTVIDDDPERLLPFLKRHFQGDRRHIVASMLAIGVGIHAVRTCQCIVDTYLDADRRAWTNEINKITHRDLHFMPPSVIWLTEQASWYTPTESVVRAMVLREWEGVTDYHIFGNTHYVARTWPSVLCRVLRNDDTALAAFVSACG